MAQLLARVHDDRRALGGKSVLVGVARDGGDTLDAEIHLGDGKAGLFHEGEEEAAEAPVDMEADTPAEGDFGKGLDIVDSTVGESGGRADNLTNVFFFFKHQEKKLTEWIP